MRTDEEYRVARRADSKRWRERNREKWLADQRRYYDPVRQAARDAVKYALRVGWLVRPSHCSLCEVECKPHGHHPDYGQKLVVVWLCHACHMREHAMFVVEHCETGEVI